MILNKHDLTPSFLNCCISKSGLCLHSSVVRERIGRAWLIALWVTEEFWLFLSEFSLAFMDWLQFGPPYIIEITARNIAHCIYRGLVALLHLWVEKSSTDIALLVWYRGHFTIRENRCFPRWRWILRLWHTLVHVDSFIVGILNLKQYLLCFESGMFLLGLLYSHGLWLCNLGFETFSEGSHIWVEVWIA